MHRDAETSIRIMALYNLIREHIKLRDPTGLTDEPDTPYHKGYVAGYQDAVMNIELKLGKVLNDFLEEVKNRT